jgi:hypothetical protein
MLQCVVEFGLEQTGWPEKARFAAWTGANLDTGLGGEQAGRGRRDIVDDDSDHSPIAHSRPLPAQRVSYDKAFSPALCRPIQEIGRAANTSGFGRLGLALLLQGHRQTG